MIDPSVPSNPIVDPFFSSSTLLVYMDLDVWLHSSGCITRLNLLPPPFLYSNLILFLHRFEIFIYVSISFKKIPLSNLENIDKSMLAPGAIISLRFSPACFSFHHLSPNLSFIWALSSAALTAASR